MLIVLIEWVIIVISVVLVVLLLTLMERKILRYVGSRKGPNKVG